MSTLRCGWEIAGKFLGAASAAVFSICGWEIASEFNFPGAASAVVFSICSDILFVLLSHILFDLVDTLVRLIVDFNDFPGEGGGDGDGDKHVSEDSDRGTSHAVISTWVACGKFWGSKLF